jgi:hypothetical protein
MQNQTTQPQPPLAETAAQIYHWLRILFLLALAILAGWWIFRKRELIFQIMRSVIDAIRQFFRDLFRFGSKADEPVPAAPILQPIHRRFAAYKNPFLTGKDAVWTREQLVLYSFEALQAWADEQGIKPRPEQTAREFCDDLGGRFPDITSELNTLSFLYGHAAYGMAVPAGYNPEPVKIIWRYLCT